MGGGGEGGSRRPTRKRASSGKRSGSSPRRAGRRAVVYLEADDVLAAFTILETSAEPFDRWFRDHVRQVHGVALEEGFDPSELVLDFDVNRM